MMGVNIGEAACTLQGKETGCPEPWYMLQRFDALLLAAVPAELKDEPYLEALVAAGT